MTDFGTGLALDEHFDLVIDETSNLAMTSGRDELEKDLAYKVSAVLDESTGNPLSQNGAVEIQMEIQGVLADDPRVTTIEKISVLTGQLNADEFTVKVVGQSTDGPFEFVETV